MGRESVSQWIRARNRKEILGMSLLQTNHRCVLAGFLMLGAACGQAVQAPATVDELEYFNFLLRQLGSIHHHPNSKAAFEYNLVRQFGLSVPELAVLRAAGQEMEALLRQHKPIIQSIRPDHTGRLSAADNLTLASLSAQREQKVAALGNRILNQVRPQTAAQLRLPGKVLGNRGVAAAMRR